MKNNMIDVTGLNPKQIAVIEEIIAAFKAAAKQKNMQQDIYKKQREEDDKLKQLHQEFDWLVTDIGVKDPLTRSNIYGIE